MQNEGDAKTNDGKSSVQTHREKMLSPKNSEGSNGDFSILLHTKKPMLMITIMTKIIILLI